MKDPASKAIIPKIPERFISVCPRVPVFAIVFTLKTSPGVGVAVGPGVGVDVGPDVGVGVTSSVGVGVTSVGVGVHVGCSVTTGVTSSVGVTSDGFAKAGTLAPETLTSKRTINKLIIIDVILFIKITLFIGYVR